MTRTIRIALAMLSTLAVACDRGQEDSSQQQQTADQTAPQNLTPRDAAGAPVTTDEDGQSVLGDSIAQYKANARAGLESIDEQIDRLTREAKNLSGDAKLAAEQTIQELKRQRDAFADRLAEAGADTADAWSEIRSGLERAWSDLESATNAALNEYTDAQDGGAGAENEGDPNDG